MAVELMKLRLDKYLADMSIGTRQEVKKYIRQGRVKINEDIIKKPEYKTAFLFLDDYDESAVPPWAMRLRVEQEDILAEETRRNHEH